MPQTPTIGGIVHVLVDPRSNNNSDVAVGTITRVFGNYENSALGQGHTVNVRVLLDGPDTPWLPSIVLFDERPTDEALALANPLNPGGHWAFAFWPPRIDDRSVAQQLLHSTLPLRPRATATLGSARPPATSRATTQASPDRDTDSHRDGEGQ